jgi:hypothetical protein
MDIGIISYYNTEIFSSNIEKEKIVWNLAKVFLIDHFISNSI